MCLILLAIRKHRDYKLIVAANRDEYYERPSSPPHFWEDAPHVLAGRDLVAGGTWLGITRQGRFAALTNYRDPSSRNPEAPSRGTLVSRFLSRPRAPVAFLDLARKEKDRYNGFNLILGTPQRLFWYSNRADKAVPLSQGIYGLSNHHLDTPWPKVTKAKSLFKAVLHEQSRPPSEALFRLLHDQSRPPDNDLPHTGVSLEWERILSPIFITSPTYGTRSSTIILIDHGNRVTFLDKTFGSDSEPISAAQFEFDLESE
jgi:uncharacterized protein with NRDE domain